MRKIEGIVIHYSASPDVSAATIDGWHRERGFQGIGYHKVIRKNGSVENGRPEVKIGAHARGYNIYTLGAVLTGSDGYSWYPTKAQLQTLAKVMLDWQAKYPTIKWWRLHKEVGSTACPGRLNRAKVDRALVDQKANKTTVGGEEEMTNKMTDQEFKEKLDRMINSDVPGIKDLHNKITELFNRTKAMQNTTKGLRDRLVAAEGMLKDVKFYGKVDNYAVLDRVIEALQDAISTLEGV